MRSGEQRRRRYAVADNLTERGSMCYTGDDYRVVIDLMGLHYDPTGWVDTIPSVASSSRDSRNCGPAAR